MRPEQKENEQMVAESKALMDKIMSKESRDEIINYIPEADSKELEDIAYMLSKSEESSAGMLIDGFIAEKNPAYRNKFRTIFSTITEEVVKEAIDRLEYCDPSVVRDLFSILAEYSPDKAHLIAKKLMRHENARIRWEGLDVFKPMTDDEINSVFELLKKEKNEEVKKKAASVLLETRKPEVIDDLFKCTEGRFFVSKFFIKLVELCGNMRVQESFSNLKRIFLKHPFFTTKSRNDLRVAAISSIARLHTEEAMELVKEGSKDKSEAVRKMCEIILRLGAKGERLDKEDDKNAAE
jgi:HEAT repeat protein